MGKKNDGSLRVEEAPAPRHSVTAVVVWTTLVVMIILYGGFFFMTRTDGFRSYLAEYFTDRLGMPVKIGGSQSGLAMNITLSDFVAGDTNGTSLAGVKIGKAELRWAFRNLFHPGVSAITSLDLDYCQISFGMNEKGVWEPAALGQLSSLLDRWSGGRINPSGEQKKEEESGGETAPAEKKGLSLSLDRMPIKVSNSRVIWWGAQREEMAFIDGLNLTVTPVALPNRSMKHYHLTAD
ncbi:MAG: hypothetical protein V2A34_15505, partial [Lentisphaerota bacterium]